MDRLKFKHSLLNWLKYGSSTLRRIGISQLSFPLSSPQQSSLPPVDAVIISINTNIGKRKVHIIFLVALKFAGIQKILYINHKFDLVSFGWIPLLLNVLCIRVFPHTHFNVFIVLHKLKNTCIHSPK